MLTTYVLLAVVVLLGGFLVWACFRVVAERGALRDSISELRSDVDVLARDSRRRAPRLAPVGSSRRTSA